MPPGYPAPGGVRCGSGGPVSAALGIGLLPATPAVGLRHRAGDEEDVLRVDADATERAGGVGVEPRIDAFDVEAVAALGQQPERLRGLEPAQAHCALQPLLLPLQRPEPEDRERLDHRSIHPGVPPLGGGGREPPIRAPAGAVGGSAALAVPGIEEEEEGEGKDDGEHANDDGDARPEWGHEGGRVEGGRRARGGADVEVVGSRGKEVTRDEVGDEVQLAVVERHCLACLPSGTVMVC